MKSVLIHGSCVSRDILRFHPERFSASHYIARQSWISAFSRPVAMPSSLKFKSKFLQRSIEGDFKSNAARRIRSYADVSDVLVMDLATDRRGYLPIGGTAATVSYSREVEKSKVVQQLPARKRVDFGTDQHFGRFARSAMKTKQHLQDAQIFERTIILQIPFVDHSTGGQPVPQVQEKSGEKWNQLFLPYYSLLGELGFRLSDPLPDQFAVADSQHLWGIAPDHYIPEAYAWWADVIEQVAR